MRSLLALLVLPLALLALAGAFWGLRSEPEPTYAEVRPARGTVTRDAVAIGRIEPVFEIPVTPTNGGVVTAVFVELGQRVEAGDKLVEVRPVLNDRARLSAQRQLQAAREAETAAEELRAGETVAGTLMKAFQGQKSVERLTAAAARGRSSAEEQLQLLLEGSVEVEGHVIDWIVRAPAAGHVIQLEADVGMPVVPASEFGAGTPLCILGDLERPVFRGTVDELDAGRMEVGSVARITVGALPDAELTGRVSEISLLGETDRDAVRFPVELTLARSEGPVLRAGYSAVARVEVARAEDVLLVPERLVRYGNGGATVKVRDAQGGASTREVTLGLGDGLMIEVRSGLGPDDVLLERVD